MLFFKFLSWKHVYREINDLPSIKDGKIGKKKRTLAKFEDKFGQALNLVYVSDLPHCIEVDKYFQF